MRSEKKSADVAAATASIFAMGDRKKILQLSTEIYLGGARRCPPKAKAI